MSTRNRENPVIAVRDVCKYYGPFVAVENVSFSVGSHQIIALLGPNGAGKTTLMRMLTGFLPPSSGRVEVAGANVLTDRSRSAESVGYLPENGPLYLDMTPRESLRFLAGARGMARTAWPARIEAVAAHCDIGAILDKPIGKLSKGLRQRVGMAQALLHDPEILILDEPTGGLDPIQIRHFRSLVRELGRTKTVLVSTHILQEAEAVADRVLVVTQGRLAYDGSADDACRNGSLEQLFYRLTSEPAVAHS